MHTGLYLAAQHVTDRAQGDVFRAVGMAHPTVRATDHPCTLVDKGANKGLLAL